MKASEKRKMASRLDKKMKMSEKKGMKKTMKKDCAYQGDYYGR